MKHSSRNSSANKLVALAAGGCLLLASGGCLPETWQRKFIRKSTHQERPSPITQFQDYTRAMTPLDRYRKHYAMFDYWNADLLAGLPDRYANAKAIRHASKEALTELQALRGLLQEDVVGKLDPLLDERGRLDRQLQQGNYTLSQLESIGRTLDKQTREIHRTLYWRDVQDSLKGND